MTIKTSIKVIFEKVVIGMKKVNIMIMVLLISLLGGLLILKYVYEYKQENVWLEDYILEEIINDTVPEYVIEYIEEYYTIRKVLGKIEYYELTLEDFKPTRGYDEKQQKIMLQGYGFEKYLGQVIAVYAVVVEGHIAENNFEDAKDTVVYIMTSYNKVIGGYSYVNFKGIAPGGFFALHGESVEDIYNISYPDFYDEWYSHYQDLFGLE